MKLINIIALIILNTTFLSANAATVTATSIWCSIEVNVRGTITGEDIEKFQEITAEKSIKKFKENCESDSTPNFIFILFSNGGDVDSALKIGRIIRSLDHSTTIARNCASACIFLLSGGYSRYVINWNGNLGAGLHRFYFSQSAGSNLQEIRFQRELIKGQILDFLREMDISERVLELSESTPPENIKWLSSEEAEELRLSGVDAAYDERETAKDAQAIGLSLVEYRARNSQAKAKCTTSEELKIYSACKLRIIYRMSKDEWSRENIKRYDKCFDLIGKEPSDDALLKSWIKKIQSCRDKYPIKARQ